MNKAYRLLRFDWPLHFILLLTNWLPDNVIFFRLRGALARHFLGSCGSNLRLGRNVTLSNPSKIHLGSHIYIAYGCWFSSGDEIIVGDEALFGPYCVIVSAEHVRQQNSFRFGEPLNAKIVIGKGTLCASRVTVTAGTVIGDGTLIGSGAVVTTNIPPNVMAAGVPARVLKVLSEEN